MGYYSDVRVSTTKECFDFLKRSCDESEYAKDLFNLHGYKVDLDKPDGVVFGWRWVKWYSGWDNGVSTFESFLDDAREKGFPFEYLVLGEEGEYEMSSSGICDELAYHLEVEHVISIYT